MKHLLSRFSALLLAAALILSAAGCSFGSDLSSNEQAAREHQAAFDDLTKELFRELVCSDSLALHYTLKDPEAFGLSLSDPTLGTYGLSAMQEDLTREKAWKKALAAISPELLTASQKQTYEVLDWLFEAETYPELFLYEEPLGLVNGVHTNLPLTLSEYAFYSLQDVEDYLVLLQSADDYFKEIIAFEQQKAQAGLFMSDAVARQVLTACKDLCEEPENSYLISSFEERLEELTRLTEAEKADLCQRNRKALSEDFFPAYQILIDGLEDLLGSGRTDRGLCSLPLGRDYGRALLAAFTGSDRSPEEMEDLLISRLNDLLSRMGELLRRYPSLIRETETFSFSLEDPEQILSDLQKKMQQDFPELPVEAFCTVKYVPEALAESVSPAFCMIPPLDAFRSNVLYINPLTTKAEDLYSTMAHEAYPGHLYQNVYSRAVLTEPLRNVLSFSGYSEGWATYVEAQSFYWDEGLSKPLQELLSCNSSVSVLLYGLLDLYINYFGYDLQDTGAFLENYFGVSDNALTGEIYTYIIGDPLNYLKYAGGFAEITQLREEAENALGSDFDPKAFHTFLLESGEAPFPVLRKWMEEWISSL